MKILNIMGISLALFGAAGISYSAFEASGPDAKALIGNQCGSCSSGSECSVGIPPYEDELGCTLDGLVCESAGKSVTPELNGKDATLGGKTSCSGTVYICQSNGKYYTTSAIGGCGSKNTRCTTVSDELCKKADE